MGPPCEFGRCGRTTARYLGMQLLLLELSGCASMITSTYPAQERVEEGQVTVGPIVGHDFELQHVDGNRFKLFKTPLCRELVEKKRITKKQTREVSAAMAEVPFWGKGRRTFRKQSSDTGAGKRAHRQVGGLRRSGRRCA